MLSFLCRHIRRCTLALLLAYLISPYAYSGLPSVPLDQLGEQGPLALNGVMQMLTVDKTMAVDDVIQIADQQWEVTPAGKRNFGQSDAAYWFRIRVQPAPQQRAPAYLRMSYPLVDQLDVYLMAAGEPLASYQVGDSRRFDARPVANRLFLFPLPESMSTPLDIYVRVASLGPIEAPLDILTVEQFHAQDKQDLLWYGAYFGVMVVMFFFNLFVYLLVRDSTYLYYLFYVAATAGIQFAVIGAGFQYLWPHHPELNNPAVLLLTGLSALAAVMFVRQFVRLDTHGNVYERLTGQVLTAIFVVLIIAAFVLPYRPVLNITHLVSFLAVMLGVYVGVAFWMRGVRAARTFAIAWALYLTAIALYLADLHNILELGPVASRSLQIGSALELVLLSLAFGQRINDEKEMRLRAQKEALEAQTRLSQGLDKLVRQRTEELQAANKLLTEASIRDSLTGVFNRRHFDQAYELEYQRCHRDLKWLSVLMVDVDHFKTVNDTYGHQAGDEILKRVADMLSRAAQRAQDVLARFGGEEFVVLLPGADGDAARQVAEGLRAAVESMSLEYEGDVIDLTISVGVASHIPDSPDAGSDLLRQADENLYRAKRSGRNRVIG